MLSKSTRAGQSIWEFKCIDGKYSASKHDGRTIPCKDIEDMRRFYKKMLSYGFQPAGALQISFDDAADMINRMTKDNLYELTSSSKMAPSPWETWADRHISVRYALDAYSKKQLKDIRHYDRWHKHAGLILKGHYAYKQPLFA